MVAVMTYDGYAETRLSESERAGLQQLLQEIDNVKNARKFGQKVHVVAWRRKNISEGSYHVRHRGVGAWSSRGL